MQNYSSADFGPFPTALILIFCLDQLKILIDAFFKKSVGKMKIHYFLQMKTLKIQQIKLSKFKK